MVVMVVALNVEEAGRAGSAEVLDDQTKKVGTNTASTSSSLVTSITHQSERHRSWSDWHDPESCHLSEVEAEAEEALRGP